jgi:peptidoglycan hydrolase-like protein with peptidoglycan-binding domain
MKSKRQAKAPQQVKEPEVRVAEPLAPVLQAPEVELEPEPSFLDGWMASMGAGQAQAAPPSAPAAPPSAPAPPPPQDDAPDLDGNYLDVHRKHDALASGLRRDTTSKNHGAYEDEIQAFQKHYTKNKKRYDALSKKHGIPAPMIAALHEREGDGSFEHYLAQGARLGTDPRAQGMAPYHKPMDDWDESADWALEAKAHHAEELEIDANTRDPAQLAAYAEMYNGLGYHGRNKPSGYIYAGTDAYQGGHFSKDGDYDPNGRTKQPGIMALLESVGAVDLDLDSEEARSRPEEWARLRYGAETLDEDSSGTAVEALQERLLGDKGVTGKMDASTLEALTSLQKQSGIQERSAVGNPEIRNLLAGELWGEMTRDKDPHGVERGSTGLSAQLVQQELIQAGKLSGGVDGMFGPNSARALKKAGGLDALVPSNTFAAHTPETEAAGGQQGPSAGAQGPAQAPTPTPAGPSTPSVVEQVPPEEEFPIGEAIYKKGATGADVESIQRLLGGKLEVDGKLGPKTDTAIRAFQKANNLTVDGKVGPKTRAALYAAKKPKPRRQAEPRRQEAPGRQEAPRRQEGPEAQTPEPDAPAQEGREQEGPAQVPAGEARDHTAIDKLLAQDWKGETVDRDSASEAQTQQLQTALRELGYLPSDATSDGKFGPGTTNALMAFQVATSGVDTIERGRDAQGNPIYARDGDRNRLQGVVDGRLGPQTRQRLIAALEAERESRKNGTQPDTSEHVRSMGDTPEQKKKIAAQLQKQGLDPETIMNVDTSRFSKLGLRPHVLDAALDSYENQLASGRVTNTTITVTDFELPDNMKRSFTIDLANPEAGIKMHELMAHGSGTGQGRWAKNFGGAQRDRSRQSVLGGLEVAGKAYVGSKQYGAPVDGLEAGINDRSDPRLIRMHAQENGSLSDDAIIGRDMDYKSWGCMVMSDKASKTYRDEAKAEGGRFNFNFAPHEQYFGNGSNDVTGD